MMALLLLLFALIQQVSGICQCQDTSQPSPGWPPGTFFITNPHDDLGYPCVTNCSYTLDSQNSTLGIGNYQLQQLSDGDYSWSNDGGANTLSFYNINPDGSVDPKPLAYNLDYTNHTANFISSTTKVLGVLKMTQNATIFASLSTVLFRSTSPSPPSTTSGPPTTNYPGPLAKNPALISHDILFMLDSGKNSQVNMLPVFNESKQLMLSILNAFPDVSVFSGNATEAPTSGSRFAIKNLNLYNSGYGDQPWHTSTQSANNIIQTTNPIMSYPASYSTSLASIFTAGQNPFSISNEKDDGIAAVNSRPHAQRTILIVGSSAPSDWKTLLTTSSDPGKKINDSLLKYDVHILFIGYKLNPADFAVLDDLKNVGWAYDSADDLSEATINRIINNNLIDPSNECGDYSKYNLDPTSPVEIVVPFTFIQPESNTKWTPNAQTSRYCNFQTNTFTFKAAAGGAATCFNVIYELETDQDKLTFSDANGNKVVTFTGVDVQGTTFQINGTVTATFTSNWSQVFGGFQIIYSDCA